MGHHLGNPVIHRSSKLLTCSLASRGKSETRDWGQGLHGALEFWDSAPGLRIPNLVLIFLSHHGLGPEAASEVAGWEGHLTLLVLGYRARANVTIPTSSITGLQKADHDQ